MKNTGNKQSGSQSVADQSKDSQHSSNITEQERYFSSHALNEFKQRRYDSCSNMLRKLADLRPNDPRVLVNRAVVDYYQSGLCKTDEFRKQLAIAKKQLEHGSSRTPDELDDIDRSFLLYQEAVIHFHVKQPKAAINILERLFKVIEPLDDILAKKVCFLLVDIYLRTFRLDQANGMLKYIETMLFSPKSVSQLASGDKESEAIQKDILIQEQYRTKLFVLRSRLFLLKRSLNDCKRELKFALGANNNSPEGLFLKSNYEYLRNNFPKAIKLLKSAPKNATILEIGQSLSTLFYNNMACIHFQMGKYNLASFYSRKALEENIAALKSLPFVEKNHQLSGRPLHTLRLNRRSEILYNMGVQLLYAGKYGKAFDCLLESHDLYQCHPGFWLRLAECCVNMYQQFQLEVLHNPSKKSDYVRGVVGTGPHRKIVLSPIRDFTRIHGHDSQSAAMPASTLEFGNICLNNALLLLPNAKEIDAAFKQLEGQSGEALTVKSASLGAQLLQAAPGGPLSVQEIQRMRISVLACHAYVSLGLGDYVKALDFSRELLKQKLLPGALKFLGHLYAAEALIKLDKISDAIQDLSPDNVADISTSVDIEIKSQENKGSRSLQKSASQDSDQMPPNSHVVTKDLFPSSVQEGKAIMLFNLAHAYCLRSEFDKAKRVLQQVVNTRLPDALMSHAVLFSIYLELQNGNVSNALDIIKQGQPFPSGRLVDRIDAMRLASAQHFMSQVPQLHQHHHLFPSQAQTPFQQQPIHPPPQRPFGSSAPGFTPSGHTPFQGRSSFSDHPRSGFVDQHRFPDQPRLGFGDQTRSVFGDQTRSGFGDQPRPGFSDQTRSVFGEHPRSGFADQPRPGGFGDQGRSAFGEPPRSPFLDPPRSVFNDQPRSGFNDDFLGSFQRPF